MTALVLLYKDENTNIRIKKNTSIVGTRKNSFQVTWVLCHTLNGISMPIHSSNKRSGKYLNKDKDKTDQIVNEIAK